MQSKNLRLRLGMRLVATCVLRCVEGRVFEVLQQGKGLLLLLVTFGRWMDCLPGQLGRGQRNLGAACVNVCVCALGSQLTN